MAVQCARGLLRVIAFPLLLGGSIFVGAWGVENGKATTSLLVMILIVVGVLVAVFERAIPFSVEWNRSQGDVKTDLTYLFVNSAVHPILSGITLLTFSTLSRGFAYVSPWSGSLWPSQLPFAIQVTLAVMLREFCHYWLHRYTHQRGRLLWRFHAIHHQPTRLYWLNANRLHLGNSLADALVGIGPLIFLGPSVPVYFMTSLVIGVMNSITHANIDFVAGPLKWVFNLPEWHRWHHERDAKEGGSNFGDILIVWDWLFGTRTKSGQVFRIDQVGLDRAERVPEGFLNQLYYPIRGY